MRKFIQHYMHPLHVACRIRDFHSFFGVDTDFRALVQSLAWYEVLFRVVAYKRAA